MPDENAQFKLPDVMPTDKTELEALEAGAVAAFETRHAQGAATPEDLAELRELAEAVRAVRASLSDGEGEPEEVEEPAEPAEPTEAPAEPAVEAEPSEPAAEPEPEAPAAPEATAASGALDLLLLDAPTHTPTPAAPAAPVQAVEAPVTTTPAAPAAPAPAPAPVSLAASAEDFQLPIARPNPVTIVASADIPGVAASSSIDGMGGLVRAMSAKARSLGDARGRGNAKGYPVASIQKPLSEDRSLDGLSEKDQFARMEELSSPAFLVASGAGWCAPSETVYEFACEVEAPPEALVLPTASTSRGGQKYPISPTFRDFYALENNGLFTWTEQDDIDALGNDGTPETDTVKPCFKIPCVDFDEARLELEGLCATAGNMSDLAYPELTRRYVSLLLTAHLHRMNARKISKALAFADDAVTMAGTFAAASALLDALELQVADLRDQFSMSENAAIEGMFPRWLRGLIRVDVARRTQVALDTVSNADIQRYLQAAGMHIQFVSDWQLLGDMNNPATQWPASVTGLLWLPGALRELTGPSLDINVTRDSVLNETNDFSVVFTEESFQVYAPGCGIRTLEVPVCPNGAYGAPVELLCAEESS